MSDAASWSDIQGAIQQWIVYATGLDADRVRWAQQGGMQPASTGGAWISINVTADNPRGRPWVDIEDNGSTIGYVGRTQNEGMLSIQIFGASPVGNASGMALARNLKPALKMPTVRDLLDGVIGFGTFQISDTPATINKSHVEPRTLITCSFSTAAEIHPAGESSTWIEHVETTGELD